MRGNDETKDASFPQVDIQDYNHVLRKENTLTTYNSFVAPVNDLGWWTDSAWREQDWYLIESWRQKKIR